MHAPRIIVKVASHARLLVMSLSGMSDADSVEAHYPVIRAEWKAAWMWFYSLPRSGLDRRAHSHRSSSADLLTSL